MTDNPTTQTTVTCPACKETFRPFSDDTQGEQDRAFLPFCSSACRDKATTDPIHRFKGWRVWIEYFARQWKAPNKRGMALRYTLRERFLCAVRMARAARLIHNGPPYR